jgi:hypothetical protein
MKETGDWKGPWPALLSLGGFTGLGGYRSYNGSFNPIGSFGNW